MVNVARFRNRFSAPLSRVALSALLALTVIALTGLAAQGQEINVRSVGPNGIIAEASSPSGTGLTSSLKAKVDATYFVAKRRLDIDGHL